MDFRGNSYRKKVQLKGSGGKAQPVSVTFVPYRKQSTAPRARQQERRLQEQ